MVFYALCVVLVPSLCRGVHVLLRDRAELAAGAHLRGGDLYIYIYIYIHTYIHIYRERERAREREISQKFAPPDMTC